MQIAAGEELLDGPGDDGSPEAATLLVAVVVHALELVGSTDRATATAVTPAAAAGGRRG
jgi:hypothetical protein